MKVFKSNFNGGWGGGGAIVSANSEEEALKVVFDELGFNRSTINTRVRMCGWSYEKALTTPIRKHKQYKQR